MEAAAVVARREAGRAAEKAETALGGAVVMADARRRMEWWTCLVIVRWCFIDWIVRW